MKRILAAIHDPGGASWWAPVLELLAKEPAVNLTLVTSTFTRGALEKYGLRVSESLPTSTTPNAVAALGKKYPYDLLITGTSWSSNSEQELRNHAALGKLPSVTAADYWANYSVRWNGSNYAISDLRDRVFVLDRAMKSEMISEGFPENSLEVVGHPRLEVLARGRQFGFGDGSKLLFVAEPAGNCDAQRSPGMWGRVLSENPQYRTIHVKPHPKETNREAWDALIQIAKSRSLDVEWAPSDLRLPEDLSKYAGVIGFQSMALLEAAVSGHRVFALPEPGVSPSLVMAMRSAGVKILSDRGINSGGENRSFTPSEIAAVGATANTVRSILRYASSART